VCSAHLKAKPPGEDALLGKCHILKDSCCWKPVTCVEGAATAKQLTFASKIWVLPVQKLKYNWQNKIGKATSLTSLQSNILALRLISFSCETTQLLCRNLVKRHGTKSSFAHWQSKLLYSPVSFPLSICLLKQFA